jgi:hydrogenase maturation protein HypF
MQRLAIEVRGIVQGVGFRPHVFALASRLGLAGFVRNHTGGVLIEVEGQTESLDVFIEELNQRTPPLARIESLACDHRPLRRDLGFAIEASQASGSGEISISPDVATCDACLAELFDPKNRRFRYPFINCTHCGPRLTIVTGSPYDRAQTTMAEFAMCVRCKEEYEDPANRRFHAQPIACPDCGPQLSLLGRDGVKQAAGDPLKAFAASLRAGRIGALKGIGGYQLVCDARNAAAVDELRRRKERDEKPLAVLLADVAAAGEVCEVNAAARDLLISQQAPIVVLRRRAASGERIAAHVAPRSDSLGVMLPYSPLHHLLVREMAPAALVVTSGNRSDEPIAYRDDDAIERLASIADCFLLHDRPIHVRCDDSVTRLAGPREIPLRRARGYSPAPIRLPFPCKAPVLAVGGQLKATFALGVGRRAIVSHHLGDLDHLDAYRAFVRDVALFEELFESTPAIVAHDLHPDYASTRYAEQRRLPQVAVQHHHAHLASCLVEHGLNEPVIGVIFDGAGLGTDGAIWGGEFLVGDCAGFRRAANLRYAPMPGGERAAREGWRMAAAHMRDADRGLELLLSSAPAASLRTIETMLARRMPCPQTSSMGRLFDAVAAIAGVRAISSFEGQAAMELESLAADNRDDGVYSWDIARDVADPLATAIIDPRPLIRDVADDARRGVSPTTIARRFHSSVIALITDVCEGVRGECGLEKIVLSGGVFTNAILAVEAESHLTRRGFSVYLHRLVPANDGGLSLGQLAIAARWQENSPSP